MKLLFSQTNFTAGQISADLLGHTDTKIYTNGLKTATNCFISARGPVVRRNGSKFISQAKSVVSTGNSVGVKFLEFQFSASDGYLLEFGDPASGTPYIRFYSSGGQVLEAADTITGITQASPAVVTTSAPHGLTEGDNVYITDVVGMTQINRPNKPYQVGTVGSATTFEVKEIGGGAIDSTGYTSYSSAGTVEKIYEIASPYDILDIETLSYVQYGNTLYIAHPDYFPRKLTRVSNTNWTLEPLEFLPEPTVELGYEPTETLTPAATTGTAVNFTAGGATWLQGDVGRQIINNSTGETGKAIITSITSSTVAVARIIEAFTDTNAIAAGDWSLDLSPIAKLKFSGYEAGSLCTVTSYYPAAYRGPAITIAGITAASPAVVTTSGSHGLSSGDKVEINNVLGMTQINTRNFYITSTGATTFSLQDGTGTGAAFSSMLFNAYTSGGNAKKIFTDVLQDTFRAADVNRYILANGGVLKILSVTSATEVVCEVQKGMTTADSTENWTNEELDWTADRGYPRCVGLFQERLVFGGTESKPTTLYFSETGIFDGFGVGTEDADAIIVDIASKDVNEINWFSNSRDLIVGTAGAEFTVVAPSASTGLSATNIEIKARTYHGSGSHNPASVGYETLFIQGASKKIRAFRYDFNLDGYIGDDLFLYADTLNEDGIKEVTFTQEPQSTIYAITNGGSLLVGTYVRDQSILAWTEYTTEGNYENVATISNGTTEEVWVCVKRTINGNTYRFIELFDESTGEDRLDGFSDCYLTYSEPKSITSITKANPAVVTAAAHGFSNGDRVKLIDVGGMSEVENISFLVANKTTNTFELTNLQGTNINSTTYTTYTSGGEAHKLVQTISGLDHLEGESVEVKVNGAVTSNKTVTSGAITLTNWAYEVTVGLPYTTTIELLDRDIDLGRGSMQGQQARFIQPILRVNKSTFPLLDGTFQPSRHSGYNMDTAVPLYTGDLYYDMLPWDSKLATTITVSTPLPFRLNAIFGAIEGNPR